eukprot:scaffold15100_cov27-Tisochrysis_lutea.AAC.3
MVATAATPRKDSAADKSAAVVTARARREGVCGQAGHAGRRGARAAVAHADSAHSVRSRRGRAGPEWQRRNPRWPSSVSSQGDASQP